MGSTKESGKREGEGEKQGERLFMEIDYSNALPLSQMRGVRLQEAGVPLGAGYRESDRIVGYRKVVV